MNNTWIKLYRKVNDKGLMKDHLAYILFNWILINVDRKTGEMKLGRYRVCDELGINPSTYYKVLQRLEKKWHIISTQSTNKWTTVCVDNWGKYQHQENIEGKQQVTDEEFRENESNTLQEVENIQEVQEVSSLYNLSPSNPRALGTNPRALGDNPRANPKKLYASIEDLTQEVLEEIAEDYNVPIGLVNLQHEKMKNWLEAKGKTYKNYNRALRNWVLDEAKKTVERRGEHGKYRSVDASGV